MAFADGQRVKGRAAGEVVLGKSAEKKTPFVELYFAVTEGDNKGGQVRWTGYFTENTAERTIESLQHCGWEGDDPGEFADGYLHGLDKNEVELVIELETYEKEGETRTVPRVRWVNRAGGHLNVKNAMSKEDASAFGDKMRGLVLKMKQKKEDSGTDFAHGANAPKATGTQRKGW